MGFQPFLTSEFRRLALVGLAILGLAACTDSGVPKELKPVPHALVATMEQLNMKETSPIFVRLYKESSELEIWKETRNGDYALLKTYQICKWSGALGPKKKEGDRQAPEGVYIVTPAQMNPNSSYYLSFNIGYPNAYDRSLDRTGSNLMVHGACSSSGCYSMTDADAGEIFALARDSFRGGQTSFQIQALPFRMTAVNLARHRDDPNMDFWRMLKVGSDNFELTRRPPKVDVCDKRYVFNADAPAGASFNASAPCPAYTIPQALADALARKQAADDADFAQAAATLDAQQKAAADKAAAVAAKEAQAAADADQPRPTLMQRLLGQSGDKSATAATTTGTTASTRVASAPADKAVADTGVVATQKVASVPVPRLRPDKTQPVAASATTNVVTTTTTTTSADTISPAMTPQIPEVGKFVKKKFDWPGDGDVVPGGGNTSG